MKGGGATYITIRFTTKQIHSFNDRFEPAVFDSLMYKTVLESPTQPYISPLGYIWV